MLLKYLPLFLFLVSLAFPETLEAQRKKKQSRTMQAAEEAIELSAAEIRLMVERYSEDFILDVMSGADSIFNQASDPEIQRNALRWKISASTAIQHSILVQDPFAGLVDQAALTYQMDHFFRDGRAASLFGTHQPIAERTCNRLKDKIRNMILNLSEDRDLERAEVFLEDFAAQNPMESIYFIRPSALPEFGALIGGKGSGIGKITRSLEESMERLAFTVNSSILLLSEQVVWQAELTALEMTENLEYPAQWDTTLSNAYQRIDSLTHQLSRVLEVAEHAPEIIDRQRALVVDEVEEERAIVLSMVRRERLETIRDLQIEIDSTLYKVTLERIAVLQAVDEISEKRMDQAFDKLDILVARTLRKATLFGMLAGAVLVVLVLVVLFVVVRAFGK